MKMLKIILMLLVFAGGAYTANIAAATEAVVMNKHLGKLLGTWTNAEGDVTFNANNTLVYKGEKHLCAIAQGTIQISKKKVSKILPYRFLDGKLLITDGGNVTTYTKVP